jgi:thiamine-phosphate diphosphorylase
MLRDRPIVCLVTDRRRESIDGDAFDVVLARLAELARSASDAGVDLIQVRERDLDTSRLAELVSTIVDTVRGSTTRVVVNDRLDVALACGAGGVHLRSDSISAAEARSMSPAGFLVGRSVHGVEDAVAHAAAVDYLVAGTVFPTPSKPGATTLLGVHGLHEIARAVHKPVLAIGGVTIEHVPEIAAAGAAGFAAIGLFLGSLSIAEVMAVARTQFDIAGAPS